MFYIHILHFISESCIVWKKSGKLYARIALESNRNLEGYWNRDLRFFVNQLTLDAILKN